MGARKEPAGSLGVTIRHQQKRGRNRQWGECRGSRTERDPREESSVRVQSWGKNQASGVCAEAQITLPQEAAVGR